MTLIHNIECQRTVFNIAKSPACRSELLKLFETFTHFTNMLFEALPQFRNPPVPIEAAVEKEVQYTVPATITTIK